MNEILIKNNIAEDFTGGCFDTAVKYYSKGEIILRHLREEKETGIVLAGTVLIISINSEGQKSIIDVCTEGDAFGDGLFPDGGLNACYALAKTKCTVAYADYNKLIRRCEKSCEKHAELIDYLLGTAVRRSMMHIDILSRRSIREKLLLFFEYFFGSSRGVEKQLPLSLSELADYLCCDRSAMMREIKKLNDSGVLTSNGRKITLRP